VSSKLVFGQKGTILEYFVFIADTRTLILMKRHWIGHLTIVSGSLKCDARKLPTPLTNTWNAKHWSFKPLSKIPRYLGPLMMDNSIYIQNRDKYISLEWRAIAGVFRCSHV
jgi:hypothetical protein